MRPARGWVRNAPAVKPQVCLRQNGGGSGASRLRRGTFLFARRLFVSYAGMGHICCRHCLSFLSAISLTACSSAFTFAIFDSRSISSTSASPWTSWFRMPCTSENVMTIAADISPSLFKATMFWDGDECFPFSAHSANNRSILIQDSKNLPINSASELSGTVISRSISNSASNNFWLSSA